MVKEIDFSQIDLVGICNLTEQLTPKYGQFGGRFFSCDLGEIRLNDLVKIFQTKIRGPLSEEQQKLSRKIAANVIRLDATQTDRMPDGVLKWICTRIRQAIGNLFYNRKKVIEKVLNPQANSKSCGLYDFLKQIYEPGFVGYIRNDNRFLNRDSQPFNSHEVEAVKDAIVLNVKYPRFLLFDQKEKMDHLFSSPEATPHLKDLLKEVINSQNYLYSRDIKGIISILSTPERRDALIETLFLASEHVFHFEHYLKWLKHLLTIPEGLSILQSVVWSHAHKDPLKLLYNIGELITVLSSVPGGLAAIRESLMYCIKKDSSHICIKQIKNLSAIPEGIAILKDAMQHYINKKFSNFTSCLESLKDSAEMLAIAHDMMRLYAEEKPEDLVDNMFYYRSVLKEQVDAHFFKDLALICLKKVDLITFLIRIKDFVCLSDELGLSLLEDIMNESIKIDCKSFIKCAYALRFSLSEQLHVLKNIAKSCAVKEPILLAQRLDDFGIHPLSNSGREFIRENFKRNVNCYSAPKEQDSKLEELTQPALLKVFNKLDVPSLITFLETHKSSKFVDLAWLELLKMDRREFINKNQHLEVFGLLSPFTMMEQAQRLGESVEILDLSNSFDIKGYNSSAFSEFEESLLNTLQFCTQLRVLKFRNFGGITEQLCSSMPNTLISLEVHSCYVISVKSLPVGLQSLALFNSGDFIFTDLPSNLKHLRIDKSYEFDVTDDIVNDLPLGLEFLELRGKHIRISEKNKARLKERKINLIIEQLEPEVKDNVHEQGEEENDMLENNENEDVL